mmetsp:Transcript_29954/g.41737  ORF Transcript_29954/g.41737 Transcript_29954/m.41737 type:complete len:126 (-) Transcript_29954:867-1244(-)
MVSMSFWPSLEGGDEDDFLLALVRLAPLPLPEPDEEIFFVPVPVKRLWKNCRTAIWLFGELPEPLALPPLPEREDEDDDDFRGDLSLGDPRIPPFDIDESAEEDCVLDEEGERAAPLLSFCCNNL